MKWNIQKRLLFLVLAAGVLSFLTLSGLSFYGINAMRGEMISLGVEVSKAGANFTRELIMYQLKKTLGEVAKSRAEFIEQETIMIQQDVEMLANIMTKIASNPENHNPVKILDPRFDRVKNFQPYVIYSPGNFSPELEHEIGIASNISSVLVPLSKTFSKYKSSFNVGSRNGYFIGVTLYPEITGTLPFSDEDIYQYDCRERPWYKIASDAKGAVFSDVFTNSDSTDNYQAISCSAPYYDKNGMAGVVSIGLTTNAIYDTISETMTGGNNFSFVLNAGGEIIFSTLNAGELATTSERKDLRKSSGETLAYAAKKMVEGSYGILAVTVDGEEYFLAYAPIKSMGWSFATLTLRRNIAAAAEDSQNYFFNQIDTFLQKLRDKFFIMAIAALILLMCLLYFMISSSKDFSRRLIGPLHELSDGVREISSGNFDKKLEIKTGDEIEELANSFNTMTGELKTYMANLTSVTAERERIATELNVATEIQNGLLPKDFPARADCELFATMTPAKEVGGDFYDFYFLDETHLAITVADVSGKGIPAALFMVISKTILNNFAISKHNSEGLAEVVAAANDKLCANNDATMFVTAFIGVLDLETGEFTFVNAGHNPPVIYHAAENHCDFLNVKKNFVMGPMDGMPFAEQKISLAKGDLIFIYTDGVTEALNVADEEYLPDRLIKFMNETDCRADLQTLLKNIRSDVAEHVGEAAQSDDITMFALRFKG